MKTGKKQRDGEKDPRAASAGALRARIIDETNGLRLLRGVIAVRLLCSDYTLLIMEDYLPALGQVDGTVVFLTEEDEVRLEGVHGFFKHQHNEFTLLIEDHVEETQ